jgi:hypothetical protein
MRRIRVAPILVFAALMVGLAWLVGATLSLAAGMGGPAPGALAQWCLAVPLLYLQAMLMFRLLLWAAPLRAGEIAAGSRQEFVYQVYILFHLMLFNALTRSSAVPVPVMRLVYLALGARLGVNTHTSGVICDPTFVRIGADSMVGEGALVPHVIEGARLGHYPIAIGSHVTIGAHAVVLAGVVIGDHALVAANSVVVKDTNIGDGETWGGNPARRLR